MTDWTKLRKNLIGDGKQSPLPSQIKLPMLPKAVMEFSEKAEDPKSTPKVLSKIIETDAGISCELLRMVNSSAFALRRKVSSIQQTITLMGIRSTKLFLVTTGLKQAMSTNDSKLINLPNFWSTNLERALTAREIARLMKVDPDVAFSAAMLQDFLLPVLSKELFDFYLQFTINQDSNPYLLNEYERQQFNWDHCAAAANVMLDWSFPDELICCVFLHHEGLKLLTDPELGKSPAAAVAVASLIPDPLRQDPNGLNQLLTLNAAWPEFNLFEIAEQIDSELREESTAARNYLSLKNRLEKHATLISNE
ncbi:MAG: HDOD domain-containing protein [Planctomycetes bacterium]|nr:HDOD domain-containing protein [Planctomycetota bacterium]MCH9723886.1 HDOD domain-containing protein [Planctomycetota bacterium]MCH9778612.1 HDOD domain-containing protein [Planctomycetota bacterium]